MRAGHGYKNFPAVGEYKYQRPRSTLMDEETEFELDEEDYEEERSSEEI